MAFDLMRVMRTPYRVDRFQERYFVIDGFADLLRETTPDFTPLYTALSGLSDLGA